MSFLNMVDKSLIKALDGAKITGVIIGVWPFDLNSGEYDVFDFEMILKIDVQDESSTVHTIFFSIDTDCWSLIVDDKNENFKENNIIYYPNNWNELLQISSENAELNDYLFFDGSKILEMIGSKIDLVRLYSVEDDNDSIFGIRLDFDNNNFLNFFAHWDGGFITTDNFYKELDILSNIDFIEPVLIDVK
jgi:hypothetical protein